ncbi:MAG: 16S rRNA (uracil(1498)-N(3))-methyltransferase [Burkholderiales bacterium]
MKPRTIRRHQTRLLLPTLAPPEGGTLASGHIALDREHAHHLIRVLRLHVGDQLELLDGQGHCYWATIASLSKDHATLTIASQCYVPLSPLQITLVQGLSAADHMDFSLQKGVELGLHRFIPVNCERSVSRIDAARSESKLRHWQKVAQASCMQSANPWLPHIHQAQDLGSALDWISSKTGASTTKSSTFTYRWMLDPYANQSLNEMLSSNSQRGTTAQIPNRQVSLLVGPEAGLSDQEVNAAKRAGFESIHLGPRTLRTETAAMAAIAVLQAAWGDWSQPASPRWI